MELYDVSHKTTYYQNNHTLGVGSHKFLTKWLRGVMLVRKVSAC